MRKQVVGYLQYVVGNKKFVVPFEDDHIKDMCTFLMSYVYDKEEVGEQVDETISAFLKRGQGELLNIDGYNVCEGDLRFGKVMFLYIFYCLCFVVDISQNTAEEKVTEEKDTDFEWEEKLGISDDRKYHCN